MQTLLLFDIDGVLIHPKGYKTALRDTVNYFAAQMGQSPVDLTMDEIAIYEACGLTNEWDSAAFSVGAMVVTALNHAPHLQQATFNATLAAIGADSLSLPRPDFVGLAREVATRNEDHAVPTTICHDVLRDYAGSEVEALLDVLFADIYLLDTPTTRIQQAHVLGRDHFPATYGQPAPRDCDSALITHDTPLLSKESRQTLLTWRQDSSHCFVLYTARPCLPPEGDPAGYPPEAELAAELVELKDIVPLVGSGTMMWLARQYGRHTGDYIKPSPVQALAAIGMALSDGDIEALHAAAMLFERGELNRPLASLAEEPTQIVVFDDSTGGLYATQTAVQRLREFGFQIEFEAIGVAPEPAKQDALNHVATRVVNDVNAGIHFVLGGDSGDSLENQPRKDH